MDNWKELVQKFKVLQKALTEGPQRNDPVDDPPELHTRDANRRELLARKVLELMRQGSTDPLEPPKPETNYSQKKQPK